MNFNIDNETYDKIGELIESESSPVGIDTKKTHILILKMLSDINERLEAIEKKIGPTPS